MTSAFSDFPPTSIPTDEPLQIHLTSVITYQCNLACPRVAYTYINQTGGAIKAVLTTVLIPRHTPLPGSLKVLNEDLFSCTDKMCLVPV